MATAEGRAGDEVALPSPEVRPHLKALDGVRGLSVVLVLLTHASEANTLPHGTAIRLLGSVLDCGRFGVDLFFVLPGSSSPAS